MRTLRIILLSLISLAATVAACGMYYYPGLSQALGFDDQLMLMTTLTLAAVAAWAWVEAILTLHRPATQDTR